MKLAENSQRRWLLQMGIGFCGLFWLPPVLGSAEDVPLTGLPSPVSAAVKARFPNSKMLSADKEIENQTTIFTVSLKLRGHDLDITLTAEGKITYIEKEFEVKELPPLIAKAVHARFPKGTIHATGETLAVDGKKETLECYDVTVHTADHRVWHLEVSPAGEITDLYKELRPAELPAAVKKAVEKREPHATLKEIHECHSRSDGREKLDYYSVILQTADHKTVEIDISPAGEILDSE